MSTSKKIASICLILSLSLTGCQSGKKEKKPVIIDDKYRTAYEVFVYSFYDGDGDGIGDLKGLTEKLDYINDGKFDTETSLAAGEIWLMPISPSTTYHKYDVTDYQGIDPEYGTIEDFKTFMAECKKRGIKVILDLVMNHSSSKHPWFTEAVTYLKGLKKGETPDPSVCPYVDYYHFSKKKEPGYAPLSGTDFFYEARFWSEMPDLNLDHPAVKEEFKKIFQFWTDQGVDGFRLDAVTSYYTGKQAENTKILTWLNKTVKEIKPDAYIVGEAWTSSGEYGAYYESGVDSFFDFAFSGSDGVIASVLKGARPASTYVEEQIRADELFASKNPNFINAPFYTNHDLARSAGYYSGEHRVDAIKLAGAMNLLMRGHAFLYYGEELGMKGAGKDENKRAPMQWSADPASKGMCKGPKDMEKIDMMYGTLESQKDDKLSIYNYYKNAIRLRNTYPVIARGKTAAEASLNSDKVAAFTRTMEDGSFDPLLIVINTGETEVSLPLPADTKFKTLADSLLTGEAPVELKDGKLILPPFAVGLLSE